MATLEHSLAQQFDLGLARLKQMVESGAKLTPVDPDGTPGVWPRPKVEPKTPAALARPAADGGTAASPTPAADGGSAHP